MKVICKEWWDIISLVNINKAIADRIKTTFSDTVFSSDVKEGITRPSFFISFDNIKSSDFMNTAIDTDFLVRIYYFPSKKDNKIELLNTLESLNILFIQDNIIKVNDDFSIEIWDDIEVEFADGVLNYYIPMMISRDYNRTDSVELMEELEIENI